MLSLNLFIVVIVVIVAALAHLLSREHFSITHDQQQQKNLSHTKLKYAFSWSKCSSFEFIELINYELFIEIISCECGIYELIAKSLGLMFLFVIHILIFLALTFLWMLIKLFLYCRRAARECCADENEPSQKYDNKQITHINFSMFTVSVLSLAPSFSQWPYNSFGCWFLALSLFVSLDDGCVST